MFIFQWVIVVFGKVDIYQQLREYFYFVVQVMQVYVVVDYCCDYLQVGDNVIVGGGFIQQDYMVGVFCIDVLVFFLEYFQYIVVIDFCVGKWDV